MLNERRRAIIKWVRTDDSTGQYVAHICDGLDTYYFVDTIAMSNERYAVVSDCISLRADGDYNVHSRRFAKLFLHPYGYTTFEALCREYGKDAKRIAAECVFETLTYSSPKIFEGSFEACRNYLDDYIAKDEAK